MYTYTLCTQILIFFLSLSHYTYVYLCICIYIYMYVFIYTYMYTHILCMYPHILFKRKCTWCTTPINANLLQNIYTYIYMYIYIYIYMYVYKYIHKYLIYIIHIYARMKHELQMVPNNKNANLLRSVPPSLPNLSRRQSTCKGCVRLCVCVCVYVHA